MRIIFLIALLLFSCSKRSVPHGVDYYGQNNNKRMFKDNLRAVQGGKPKKFNRHHK